MIKNKEIYGVDLFCGIGGLTRGLLDSGIKITAGVDFEKRVKYAYEHNNNAVLINKSVKEITGEDLKPYYREGCYKLLAGCAPCQMFSSLNIKAKLDVNRTDERWRLLNEFDRLVIEVRPDFVVMENVVGLKKEQVFKDFCGNLESLGYHTFFKVVDTSEYGLPQKRKRLILIASLLGDIELLSPEEIGAKPSTLRDAVGFLPEIKAGETCKTDSLHKCYNVSDKTMEMIKHTTPGGLWNELPYELLQPRMQRWIREGSTIFRNAGHRLEYDKPCVTITGHFAKPMNITRTIHPEQDRVLSLREGLLIQTFPLNYELTEGDTPMCYAQFIGNAVPCKLGEIIGKSIVKHLENIKNGKV